jgi:hypothetical protein
MKVMGRGQWFLAGLLCLLTSCVSAWANVYATDIHLNGFLTAGVLVPGGSLTINYILNEPATAGVSVLIFSGTNVVKTFTSGEGRAGTNAGLNSVVWDGLLTNGATVSQGVYTVSIIAAAAGYDTWTNITDDSTNFSVFVPTGITVNKNTGSPYYGRVFVANGLAGGGMANGIYKYNADGSPADEGGFSTGGYQWSGYNNGYDNAYANPSPWKLDISADDILYVDDWINNGVVVSFDQEISTNNPSILRPDNYPYSKVLLSGPCVRGAGTNTQIYMADVNPGASGGLGIIRWTLDSDGVIATNDTGTLVVADATNDSGLTLAPYAVSVDTHGNIFTIQRVNDPMYETNDLYMRVLSFPPFLDANPPDTNSQWEYGAGDPTLVNTYGIAVDPTTNFVAVASRGWGQDPENLQQGGVSIFSVSTTHGFLITNICQDLDGNISQEFIDVNWDNVGNLYTLDFNDSVWRVYSPPGTNQAVTVAVPIIQMLNALTAPQLSLPQIGMGQLNFTLAGQSNVTYVIQQSPDLATWTPAATNYSPNPIRPVSIPLAGTQDFYRAVASP